jgi:hypothetical protein
VSFDINGQRCAQRATSAMMAMKKIDLAAIEEAAGAPA